MCFLESVREKDVDMRPTSGQFVRKRPLSVGVSLCLSCSFAQSEATSPSSSMQPPRPRSKDQGPGALRPGGVRPLMCSSMFSSQTQAAPASPESQTRKPTWERGTRRATPHPMQDEVPASVHCTYSPGILLPTHPGIRIGGGGGWWSWVDTGWR